MVKFSNIYVHLNLRETPVRCEIQNIAFCRLQHRLQVIGNLERGSRLARHLINRHSVRNLLQGQTLDWAHVKHSEVGNDLPHTAGAGEREGTF